jgi:hypothetical protein
VLTDFGFIRAISTSPQSPVATPFAAASGAFAIDFANSEEK